MNVNTYNKTDYENKSNWTLGQNKPNSNPNKPNLKKAKMNVNSLITKDYRKKDDFAVRKNKPNSNPISVKPKMNANTFSQKDYENETAFRPQKNKPKQTQFQTRRRFFRLLHKRLPRPPAFLPASATLVARTCGYASAGARRGSRRKQDGGLAMTFLGAFLQRVAARPEKNVDTMNLLVIKSYKFYLNYLLLLSNY